MHVIQLEPVETGVYNDHKADHITLPPDGWAMIPDDMVLPSTFPRLGSLEVAKINGVMTVASMTEGTLPEPVEPEPTEMELLQDEVTALQLALCDQYEENLALQEEVTNTQLALVELYEGGIANG